MESPIRVTFRVLESCSCIVYKAGASGMAGTVLAILLFGVKLCGGEGLIDMACHLQGMESSEKIGNISRAASVKGNNPVLPTHCHPVFLVIGTGIPTSLCVFG